MSKIDEMRRMREAQHAAQDQKVRAPAGARATTSDAAPVPTASRAPVTKVAARASKSTAGAVEGACAVCGKVRALQNGLVSNHQKGFGKMCPGSRQGPA